VSLPREHTVEEYARAVEEYRQWLHAPEQALFREDVRHSLAGKDLACYCPPGLPCHADVLLELVVLHSNPLAKPPPQQRTK
jgi:hypothetical protein